MLAGCPDRVLSHSTRAPYASGVSAHVRNMAVTLTVLVAASGCGANGDRTALAFTHPRWNDAGDLVVSTECATDLSVEVGTDHGGSDLWEVTVWGRPAMGRCRPAIEVKLPVEARTARPPKVVDGTTSMVVDLP